MVDKNDFPKLTDFGLAKSMAHTASHMVNSFVGTLIYSCP